MITVGGHGYNILGVVSVNTSFSTEELKSQWRLADTVLVKDNELLLLPNPPSLIAVVADWILPALMLDNNSYKKVYYCHETNTTRLYRKRSTIYDV